jgi:hypothetical protein
MRALLLAIVSSLALGACSSHDAAPGKPAAASASGSRPAPSKPVPTVDPCAALDQAYDDAVAHASGACKTDADCTCYPGGLGAHPTCGGITDRQSTVAIDAIANQFHEQQCRMSLECGAMGCAPRCDQGRCK